MTTADSDLPAELDATLLRAFRNGPDNRNGRAFPGLRTPVDGTELVVGVREAVRIEVRPGDLLSFPDARDSDDIRIVAIDGRGRDGLAGLGLSEALPLAATAFDGRELIGWFEGNGGRPDELRWAPLGPIEPPLVLRSSVACTIWLAVAASPADLVDGTALGPVTVLVTRSDPTSIELPPPLGPIRDEFTIDRATARAYELAAGEYVQIIDVEGQQCSDFMAFRTDGLLAGREEMIDSTVTRTMVRGPFPAPGLADKFYDSRMRPLLAVVRDTVGRHDTFALACTARGYEDRGFPGHVNCSDNISDAMASFGVAARTAWPAINFFFNTWIDQADQQLRSEESWSRAGDYVVMRAMDDVVCVSTACPDDIDPINGWNPTDVHVRIYRPPSPISRAIAYREKEDAPMSISRPSAFHSETSELTECYAPARNLWLPTSYPSIGTIGEYWACREAVTIQDLSSLRKFDIVGPDAERLLQLATTRNVARLAVWRGTYTLLCDETGALIDDGTLFRLGQDLFRWCCGSEESGRHLTALAAVDDLDVRVVARRESMPNLSIQGPRSRAVLTGLIHTEPAVPAVDDLKWFGVTVGRIGDREGPPVMVTRSGYTGELGYEIFCDRAEAEAVWRAVMAAGEPHGMTPMGSDALELLRVEAGLAAAGHEFQPGVDAFEAGLGFAVDLSKDGFVGQEALARNRTAVRRTLRGLVAEAGDVPAAGAHVYRGERVVGSVTSAIRSPTLETAIAMARLAVEVEEAGTELEVGQMDGHMKRLSARVTDIPFVDPTRSRARA